MMFAPRITDEMREHMFDNWSEKKLQSMADFEDRTIPDLKERLLEFAAFHDFDNLDFLMGHGNNVNSISSIPQLDGALVDCDSFNFEPQTPTMTSPMSQGSDDCESVFDSGATAFTTPASQYTHTPARLKVAENGSPIKRSHTEHTQLIFQTDGPSSDLTQPRNSDGSVIDTNGQPIVRLFDPEKSLKHQAVPMDLLLSHNPGKNVMHLRGVDPSTGNLQVDPNTLVIFIEGVVYDDDDGQAGAAVFFHPLSPWNTVTCVEKSKDNAKLEALYIALNMISFTAANDPNLNAIYIMCADMDLCLATTTDGYNLAHRQSVSKWLQGADKTILSEIDELWTNITEGTNGQRAVEVRLWCVPEAAIRPVTDIATAYLYEQRGRDWYAEHGKTRDHFEENSQDTPAYPPDLSIVAPQSIVSQGPLAVTKWKAEAKARLQQSIWHKIVASDGCRQLNDELRSNGELLSTERFLEKYSMATNFMSEDPQKDIDQFVAEQRAIQQSSHLQDQWMTTGGSGNVEGRETGCENEKLVQQILEMDWE